MGEDEYGWHACESVVEGGAALGGEYTITEEDGTFIGPEEASRLLSDYIIQGQAVTAAMGVVDEEGNWNGPAYSAGHVYNIEFMSGSQYINEFADWNGQLAFDLMSLQLPKDGETESAQQQRARETVEACLTQSFGFKLAHGLIG
jgi:hypothetical protein